MFGCFAVLVVRIEPLWNKVFQGYLPSKTVFGPGALYVSIGIIGATVMPHALFIGSRLATVDRLDLLPRGTSSQSKQTSKFWSMPSRNIMDLFPASWQRMGAEMGLKVRGQSDRKGKGRDATRSPPLGRATTRSSSLDERDGKDPSEGDERDVKIPMESLQSVPSLGPDATQPDAELDEGYNDVSTAEPFNRVEFIRKHQTHATVDIIFSLLGFAVTINSAILIIAATAFYFKSPNPGAATGQSPQTIWRCLRVHSDVF